MHNADSLVLENSNFGDFWDVKVFFTFFFIIAFFVFVFVFLFLCCLHFCLPKQNSVLLNHWKRFLSLSLFFLFISGMRTFCPLVVEMPYYISKSVKFNR